MMPNILILSKTITLSNHQKRAAQEKFQNCTPHNRTILREKDARKKNLLQKTLCQLESHFSASHYTPNTGGI